MEDESEKETLIKKLISILKVEEKSYSFLDKLDLDELERLNTDIQEAMYNQQAEHWQRVAKVVKFFPNFMSAKVAQQVLGPSITANICYHVETKDLVGIAKNLSIPFLTEVAENLIPAKSRRVVNEMPLSSTKKVTEELMRKKEYFIASSFLEVIDSDKIMEIISSIYKESDLIQSAEFVQNTELLKDIFLKLPKSRQTKMLQAAVDLHKEHVIINTLIQMDENERNTLIGEFLKSNPQGASAFISGLNKQRA